MARKRGLGITKNGRVNEDKKENEHQKNPSRNLCLMFIEWQYMRTSETHTKTCYNAHSERGINSEICKHSNLRLWILHYWLVFGRCIASHSYMFQHCGQLHGRWTMYLHTCWWIARQAIDSIHNTHSFVGIVVAYIFSLRSWFKGTAHTRCRSRSSDKTPTKNSIHAADSSQWLSWMRTRFRWILQRGESKCTREQAKMFIMFSLCDSRVSWQLERGS